jgi:hypothetical protein
MEKLKKFQYSLWLAIAVVLIGLTACGVRETELSFETIERNDNYSAEEGYGGLESRVVLVISQDEIKQLEGLVSQAALDQLAELDFGRYFAIAAFRSRQATSGYAIVIKRVVRKGDRIVVYAQFWEPSSYWEVQSAETSPYHLIRVRRDDEVSHEIELVLQSQLITPTPPSR